MKIPTHLNGFTKEYEEKEFRKMIICFAMNILLGKLKIDH